jgi:hypothetical protein
VKATVELPDSIYRKGEEAARAKGVTMEELIVQALERELTVVPETAARRTRVTVPLVKSKRPGSLDLENFDFDDLLA